MPGMRCAVASCNNSFVVTKALVNVLGTKIRYHTFPKDPAIRKEWIVRCHRKGPWNPDTSKVCSVHFCPEDYERDLKSELLGLEPRMILKKTAVPSLKLKDEESPITKQLSEARIERLRRRERKKLVKEILCNYSAISEKPSIVVPTPKNANQEYPVECRLESDSAACANEIFYDCYINNDNICADNSATGKRSDLVQQVSNVCDMCCNYERLELEHRVLKSRLYWAERRLRLAENKVLSQQKIMRNLKRVIAFRKLHHYQQQPLHTVQRSVLLDHHYCQTKRYLNCVITI